MTYGSEFNLDNFPGRGLAFNRRSLLPSCTKRSLAFGCRRGEIICTATPLLFAFSSIPYPFVKDPISQRHSNERRSSHTTSPCLLTMVRKASRETGNSRTTSIERKDFIRQVAVKYILARLSASACPIRTQFFSSDLQRSNHCRC